MGGWGCRGGGGALGLLAAGFQKLDFFNENLI